MPATTLRVWERRYALTQTALSPGGQRLYSADDVRRLTLLKQLTDLGHAIGSLAPLDMPQLLRVAATHAGALAATKPPRRTQAASARAPRAWHVVVVGQALGARLQRPALLQQLGRPVQVLGPFSDVAQASMALRAREDGLRPDAWLVQEPQLLAGWVGSTIEPLGPTPMPVAVLYGFATDAVCEDLAARGVALLREPQPDAVLAQWLRHWMAASASAEPEAARHLPDSAADVTAPRRWDDAALSLFASLSTTVACECPRHVAELLTQLSRFESYSVQCEHRSPADARLHAYLGRMAAEARACLESALEQVALHEGLLLPAPAA